MLHKVEKVWKKNSLSYELKCVWDIHSADELVVWITLKDTWIDILMGFIVGIV